MTILGEGTGIQADTKVESTALVKGERFPGKVQELPYNHVKAAAEKAGKYIEGPLPVSMSSDRSRLDCGRTAAGVAWKQ